MSLNICFADERLSPICRRALQSYGFEVHPVPECQELGQSVRSHPDLLLHLIGEELLVASNYLKTFESMPTAARIRRKYTPVATASPTESVYPQDVALCACQTGKYLICNEKCTDETLLSRAARLGLKIINVKQGYAKCSCAVLSDGAVITADRGIASALRKYEIPHLTVEAGHVSLPGHPYGFIGGACGLVGDRLYFAGDYRRHPDAADIENFCRLHATEPVSLSSEPLADVGSLIFL